MLAMANHIEDILTRRGMSIYRLAKEADLSYNTTHSLVKAESIPPKTDYDTLRRIARVLGVKIDDLENGE